MSHLLLWADGRRHLTVYGVSKLFLTEVTDLFDVALCIVAGLRWCWTEKRPRLTCRVVSKLYASKWNWCRFACDYNSPRFSPTAKWGKQIPNTTSGHLAYNLIFVDMFECDIFNREVLCRLYQNLVEITLGPLEPSICLSPAAVVEMTAPFVLAINK